jgi:hypothetical protein
LERAFGQHERCLLDSSCVDVVRGIVAAGTADEAWADVADLLKKHGSIVLWRE